MHVLLRGDFLQRSRLVSGLVLFAFAGSHFLNHALGLVSLEVMHQMQAIRTSVTRSTGGTVVLAAALVTHISLGLYKLAARRTLRMPLWEALQILIALAIPLLLFPHIVNTRIAHVFFNVNDIYLYELVRLWPDGAVLQSLLLVLVWVHCCIGLHYWLRLSERYAAARPALWTIAALVPIAGIAGFAVSGQLTADIMRDPNAFSQLQEQSNWPNAADGAVMAQMRDWTRYLFGAVLAALFGYHVIRIYRSRARANLKVAYHDGPTVAATRGMTLLEISRASGVPHASVCGGRARCFTCRVKIDQGLEDLPVPNRAEAVALRALEAPANIRLACQTRPIASLMVTVLHKPRVPGPLQVDFVEIKSVATAHARAVLSDDATEIENSDPAAITRWFSDKLAYPVIAPILSSQGFMLCGARLDYLHDRPAPALVYARDGHLISLFLMPATDSESFAIRGSRGGYSVVGWADSRFAYFAAADIDRNMLDALQDSLSEAIGSRVVTAEELS